MTASAKPIKKPKSTLKLLVGTILAIATFFSLSVLILHMTNSDDKNGVLADVYVETRDTTQSTEDLDSTSAIPNPITVPEVLLDIEAYPAVSSDALLDTDETVTHTHEPLPVEAPVSKPGPVESPIPATQTQTVYIGDVIPFGEHYWRVLDVQNRRALIITEEVIMLRTYQRIRTGYKGAYWEESDLRRFLNSMFLLGFTPTERARIVETKIQTTTYR